MRFRAQWKVGTGTATLGLALAGLFAAPTADAATGMRNQRYCEVIPSVVQGSTVTTYVYNTQGLNRCPADQWHALTVDEVDREYGSQTARLNGPRYWTMDDVEASGSSTTGQTFTFGGIEMSLRATIVTPVGAPTVGQRFYAPNAVQRQTVYNYEAGKPIYELIDSDNHVYVMQSYAQIVDKTLTINQLPALEHILSLPKGWRYRTKRPRHTIHLTAAGIAYVINDNLADSYQRMSKPSLQLGEVPTHCVRRPFEVTVHVGGDTANTRVSVGHRTIKRTTSNDFRVKVAATARSGRRRLLVLARNMRAPSAPARCFGCAVHPQAFQRATPGRGRHDIEPPHERRGQLTSRSAPSSRVARECDASGLVVDATPLQCEQPVRAHPVGFGEPYRQAGPVSHRLAAEQRHEIHV